MNWKRHGRKLPWPSLRYQTGIRPEGLRKKTTKNLSLDSQSPRRDLNPGPPKYEGVFNGHIDSL